MLNLDCADCHMPKLAKSATVTIAAEADRPVQGDVTSHIFAIELDSTKAQFTDDGGFAYPAIDENYACRTCHNDAGDAKAFAIPSPDGDAFIDAYIFHNNIAD